LFPDSERWQGEVSVLKQLTGQDPMRYERKGVQQCKDYVYQGMVILSANEPPESSDRTSGQERRKLTIGLDNRILEYEGRNLAEEFRQYLPGLLKRVLEIPRQRVTDLIKHTDKNVPALAQKKWSQLIETNPIAAWVDDCIVINPDVKGYVGKDDPEQTARWLYANFCQYQRESGHRGIPPVKRFSSNLRDLLKNQMKVSIYEGRDSRGAYIEGIGLRCFYDPNGTDYQRPITKDYCDNTSEKCDGFEGKCDGLVTDETLASVECDGCDGFLGNSEISEKTQEIAASKKIINQGCAGEYEENPSHQPNPTPASVPTVTNPSQQEPNPSPALQLAALLRLADCWAQVEEAIATSPESKTEAWAQLTPEEKIRIQGLKPKAVSYSKHDKVAKRVDPEQVGVIERFDASFGECLVHFEFSSEWLNPADLMPVEVKA
jgi:putative DNA primase/helicase